VPAFSRWDCCADVPKAEQSQNLRGRNRRRLSLTLTLLCRPARHQQRCGQAAPVVFQQLENLFKNTPTCLGPVPWWLGRRAPSTGD
jgi:hypothetical protein